MLSAYQKHEFMYYCGIGASGRAVDPILRFFNRHERSQKVASPRLLKDVRFSAFRGPLERKGSKISSTFSVWFLLSTDSELQTRPQAQKSSNEWGGTGERRRGSRFDQILRRFLPSSTVPRALSATFWCDLDFSIKILGFASPIVWGGLKTDA